MKRKSYENDKIFGQPEAKKSRKISNKSNIQIKTEANNERKGKRKVSENNSTISLEPQPKKSCDYNNSNDKPLLNKMRVKTITTKDKHATYDCNL